MTTQRRKTIAVGIGDVLAQSAEGFAAFVWLERHFSGMFRAVHYAGMWDTDHDVYYKLKQTKAELCREIGADYLNQVKHCVASAEAGIPAFLFGDYNWNCHLATLPRDVTRVRSWKEVEEYFYAKS